VQPPGTAESKGRQMGGKMNIFNWTLSFSALKIFRNIEPYTRRLKNNGDFKANTIFRDGHCDYLPPSPLRPQKNYLHHCLQLVAGLECQTAVSSEIMLRSGSTLSANASCQRRRGENLMNKTYQEEKYCFYRIWTVG